jgi:5-methylcytosine-specific restriction endonuclease McrA
MDATLRELVRQRASGRCEYCQIHQEDDSYYRFQIEHILPLKHGGTDDSENLALACRHCNLHKGPNLSGIDPDDGRLTPLFNPRSDKWQNHFVFQGAIIVGLSNIGRATIQVLAMNDSDRVDLRIHASS